MSKKKKIPKHADHAHLEDSSTGATLTIVDQEGGELCVSLHFAPEVPPERRDKAIMKGSYGELRSMWKLFKRLAKKANHEQEVVARSVRAKKALAVRL